MPERTSRLMSAEAAAALIPEGCTLAVGGLSYFGAPMALVRALVRRRIRGLTLITGAVASIQADLLIAAGCVRRIISPYVAFEELGLAPAFRRAAESGEIEVVEIGEAFLGFGLKAAASGAPYYPMPLPLGASGCAAVNPLYRVSRDPFSDNEIVCVPALRPDWTLLHAQSGDTHGNLHYRSLSFMDLLLARASGRVLATVDELREPGALPAESGPATIPGFLVRGVIPLYGAARPTGSFTQYGVDRAEIKRYTKAARSRETLDAYLAGLGSEEVPYQESLGASPALPVEPAGPVPDLAAAPSKAEIMATVIARSVRDGMFTGAGTGCWEVAAGLRLAQLTHAPNLSFTLGGSGAVNHRLRFLPESLNGDEALAWCEAQVSLCDLLDLELRGGFDILFVSGMQIDCYGNVNLAAIGQHARPTLRGPGTVGLEFTSRVPEVVIFVRQHSRQVFVEKLDFVSGIGYGTGPGSRARWGIDDSRGPRLVVSNLAVMDFHPQSLRMRLKSLHPGVTLNEVTENTGFELLLPDHVPKTAPPTSEELRLLRTEIDRGGLLARLVA